MFRKYKLADQLYFLNVPIQTKYGMPMAKNQYHVNTYTKLVMIRNGVYFVVKSFSKNVFVKNLQYLKLRKYFYL